MLRVPGSCLGGFTRFTLSGPALGPRYHHHDLILGPDGRKLSKSRKDTGLAALRAGGATPQDIRRMVGL